MTGLAGPPLQAYEYSQLKKELNVRSFNPRESDKKCVAELLESLDVNMFQEEVANQNSWYGYKKKPIRKNLDFREKSARVSLRTTDNSLNNLIQQFNEAIDKFVEYSSSHLFGTHDDWYTPNKDGDEAYWKFPELF